MKTDKKAKEKQEKEILNKKQNNQKLLTTKDPQYGTSCTAEEAAAALGN